MTRLLNRRENPNAIAGLFLLIMLAIFAGPTVLPQLLATTIPFIDEGVPCDWLRDGSLRARSQSLIGREVSDDPADPPIRLNVRSSGLSASNNITFTVVVINETLGTIPVLITDGDLIVNPNDPRNGLGVLVGQETIPAGVGEAVGTYPPDRIRLLGPKQLCVHRVTVPQTALPADPSVFVAENLTVTAFYRNNTPGQIPFVAGNIFQDQGLWVGTVQSEAELLNSG